MTRTIPTRFFVPRFLFVAGDDDPIVRFVDATPAERLASIRSVMQALERRRASGFLDGKLAGRLCSEVWFLHRDFATFCAQHRAELLALPWLPWLPDSADVEKHAVPTRRARRTRTKAKGGGRSNEHCKED